MSVKSFITTDTPRNVIRIHVSTNTDGDEMIYRKAGFLSGKQLMNSYGGGGTKGATPQKRKLEPGSAAEEDRNLVESSEDNEDTGDLWVVVDG
jgi:hypothetical protein